MLILTSKQMQESDAYTIKHLPITSIDLMEKAALTCVEWIKNHIDNKSFVYVFCGPGNNGGDGLAIARLLHLAGFNIKAYLLAGNTLSDDCTMNLKRLQSIDNKLVEKINTAPEKLVLPEETVIIDALFGTGLSRNVDGEYGKLVQKINNYEWPVISIDLPSGIYSDKTSIITGNEIIKADITLTFQHPKTALLVEENAGFYGDVYVLDIGLLSDNLISGNVKMELVDDDMISQICRSRSPFGHKGTFGHALLAAGSLGKMGAAILAAGGFLKSGAGLLTMLVPEKGLNIVQTAIPEAMAIPHSTGNDFQLPAVNVIGAGPGLGISESSEKLLEKIIESPHPLVLDADALNLISKNPSMLPKLAKRCIITPHPGEFKRLAGNYRNDFEKLILQQQYAVNNGLYVILKGKNTSIACPDGRLYFNSTGNSGMAKGGSGDVLTGFITGLLASGYSMRESCVLGVYLHGLAGDFAKVDLTEEGMNSGDIVKYLPQAWKTIIN